jgi:hypothetical protein
MTDTLPNHPYSIFFRNCMGVLIVFYLFHYLTKYPSFLGKTAIAWSRYIFYFFLFTPLLFLYQFYREPKKDSYIVPTVQNKFPFSTNQVVSIDTKTYWFQKAMMIALLFYFGFIGKGISMDSENMLPVFGFRGFYNAPENVLSYFTAKTNEQQGGAKKKKGQKGGSPIGLEQPFTSKFHYLYTLSYWIIGAVAAGFAGEILPSVRAFSNMAVFISLYALYQLSLSTDTTQEGGGILERGWRALISGIQWLGMKLSYLLLPVSAPIEFTPGPDSSAIMNLLHPILSFFYPAIRWILRFFVQFGLFQGFDLPYLEDIYDDTLSNEEDETTRYDVWGDFLRRLIISKGALWFFTNVVTYVILFTSGFKHAMYGIALPLINYIVIGLIGYALFLRKKKVFQKENWLNFPFS